MEKTKRFLGTENHIFLNLTPAVIMFSLGWQNKEGFSILFN